MVSRIPGLLGQGLYGPAEVARLVDISASRVRRWILGYSYVYPTSAGPREGASPAIIAPGLPRIGKSVAVTFLELVEILVVRALLERGVTMRTVRRAHRRASEKLQTPHPFAVERFQTDGRGIFLELRQESPEYKLLLEMSRGQYALPKVLDRYLKELDFDLDTLLAYRWWPLGRNRPIVLDPSVAFGCPVIEGTRVPVEAIVDAHRAGETRKSICRWFGLNPRQVSAAVSFGQRGKAA